MEQILETHSCVFLNYLKTPIKWFIYYTCAECLCIKGIVSQDFVVCFWCHSIALEFLHIVSLFICFSNLVFVLNHFIFASQRSKSSDSSKFQVLGYYVPVRGYKRSCGSLIAQLDSHSKLSMARCENMKIQQKNKITSKRACSRRT
jgi:hypothetical protein